MAKKHALVCSGGGAYGAYEVGVFKAFAEGHSPAIGDPMNEPEILTGTSVGAYNVAFMASRRRVDWRRAVRDLEQVWLDVISDQNDGRGNGVFRYRWDPFTLLNPFAVARQPLLTLSELIEDTVTLTLDGLQRLFWCLTETNEPILDRLAGLFDLSAFISTDPMRELIRETIDFDRLRLSPRTVLIAATNWTTGQLVLTHGQHMTAENGPALIQASASIPGIFPPQAIDSELYVDGGVLMNTPLRPAINSGAEVLHVIDLFPEVKSIPLRTLASTIGAMNRAQTTSWNFLLQAQLRHCGSINNMLHAFAKVHERILASDLNEKWREKLVSFLEEAAAYARRRMGRTRKYELLEVHYYRPREPLVNNPLGMLLFDRNDIESFIAKGQRDAREHDCVQNGCVLPDTPVAVDAIRRFVEVLA